MLKSDSILELVKSLLTIRVPIVMGISVPIYILVPHFPTLLWLTNI